MGCSLPLCYQESEQKTLHPKKSLKSGVHSDDFVIVYCSLVRPVLEYAAAAFANLPNHLG